MSLPSVTQVEAIPDELQPLRLYEVAAVFSISRSRLYEMMDAGIIRSVKVGRVESLRKPCRNTATVSPAALCRPSPPSNTKSPCIDLAGTDANGLRRNHG